MSVSLDKCQGMKQKLHTVMEKVRVAGARSAVRIRYDCESLHLSKP